MKKLVLILAVLFVGLSAFAGGTGANYYVVSTGEKLFCKKISVGDQYIKATLENGEKILVPTKDVKMYYLNGDIYEKLPVYENNVKTNKEIFMQFVATRAGLKLYKYTKYEEAIDISTGEHLGVKNVDHYVVYKGDVLHVELNEKNYTTLLEFFRVM